MIKNNIYIEREEEREGAGRPHITIINYNVPPDSTKFCRHAHPSKKGSPLLHLCYYHQGPWSLHTNRVCGLALLLTWDGPYAIKAPLQQSHSFHPHTLPLTYTQECKGNVHQLLYSNLSLYHLLIWSHTSHVYVICSGLGVLIYGTYIVHL